MSQSTKRRLLRAAATVLAVSLAAYVAWQLHSYRVDPLLTLAVAVAVYGVMVRPGLTVADSWSADRFSCPDCPFSIELVADHPQELEQWRQRAADHPHHPLRPLAALPEELA